jgi:hypothetical protein
MKSLKMAAMTLMWMSGIFTALPAFAGPKWDMGDDSWLKLGLLGQVHYSALDDAPVEHDFYLRRLRLILEGQLMEGAKVFVETDYPNAGKSGVNASFTVQDAFVDLQLFKSAHWVKGGLSMLPFSFENGSSATSLLGLDYNTECLKFVNDLVWRDTGVSFQGSVAKRFAYRVGVFDGYDNADKYPDANLRYTGRADVAVLGEVPTGWFYAQDPISDKTYLYLGAGVDHQDNATVANGSPRDNRAWVVDFQSGVKLSDILHLTLNGAWYDWDNSKFNGKTAFVESGLRYQKYMGTVKYTLEDPDSGSNLDNYTVGVHYNLKGNNLKAGVEYRWGDSSNWLLAGMQFLI